MALAKKPSLAQRLMSNNRFWILMGAVVLSINVAGFVQLLMPAGASQTIRVQEIYGFISMALLYVAILASPLTKVYTNLPFKEGYLHARRAIGVSAFYFASLHVYISFFEQLGGFGGVKYYNPEYAFAILCGVFSLGVLLVMASTSLNWIVNTLGFKKWKLLHRLVYLASISVLIHIILLGSHYDGLGIISVTTGLAVAFLLWLEARRLWKFIRNRREK